MQKKRVRRGGRGIEFFLSVAVLLAAFVIGCAQAQTDDAPRDPAAETTDVDHATEASDPLPIETPAVNLDELVVWSWRADTAERLDGVTPMVWAHINYGHRPKRRGTNYHTARPDHEIAAEVIPALLAQPPGRRALFLWYVGEAEGVRGAQADPPLFPEGRAAEALARGGLTAFTEAHTRRLMQRLNLAEAVPDFVVLDYEGGANRWQLGKRRGQADPVTFRVDVEAVWAQASSAMPASLSRLGAERFLASGPGREETAAFNAWAARQRQRALRDAVVEPTWQALGLRVPISNYGASVRAWEVPDLHGWPQPRNGELPGSWSSPVSYLGIGGNRYKHGFRDRTDMEKLAVNWIDQRNEVRAALAWSPHVAPWVSRPDYERPDGIDAETWRWSWAAGLLHDRSMGVPRILLWSGRAWSDEEVAFAQRVFDALHALPAERPDALSPLPDDPVQAAEELQRWIERAIEMLRQPDAKPALDSDP